MYINLVDYMMQDRVHRRSHLRLDEDCIDIGGDSRLFRGLLAHHVKTTIDNKKALVCHACHNPKCSNVNHLYWGTYSDNTQDSIENGTHVTIHERMKNKYTQKEIDSMMSKNGKLGGIAGGGHNKLSDDIISSRIRDFNSDEHVRGRIGRLSEKWKCSHTQVSRFIKKHVNPTELRDHCFVT